MTTRQESSKKKGRPRGERKANRTYRIAKDIAEEFDAICKQGLNRSYIVEQLMKEWMQSYDPATFVIDAPTETFSTGQRGRPKSVPKITLSFGISLKVLDEFSAMCSHYHLKRSLIIETMIRRWIKSYQKAGE